MAYVKGSYKAAAAAQQAKNAASKASSSVSGGGTSSSTKTVSVPSGITSKNASAQLKAGNISQAQYNQIMGGSNSTPTQSATAVNYTFTNPTTGKSQTLTQDQYNKLSPSFVQGLSAQGVTINTSSTPSTPAPVTQKTYTFMNPATGKSQTLTQDQYNKLNPSFIQGLSAQGVTINTSSTPAPITSPVIPPKITPTITNQPNVTASGKTISQDAYDSIIAKAREAGVSEDKIQKSIADMQSKGITIAPTQQITPNQAGDVLNNKQTVIAPNGKTYEITIGKDGKASFQSQGGLGTRVFNSIDEAINTINTANPPTKVPVVPEIYEDPDIDRLKEGESDIQGINELVNFSQETQDTVLQAAQDQMAMLQPYIDQLAQYNQQTATALDSTISQRFQSMNDNFAAISNSIKELETKANDLFDVNAMVARQTRAKQLADAGILTSEQAASAAQYSMQDYTMNVELKRSELMQQAQEAMTNALKEKSTLQDQILQQQGIDAVTKQNMVQQVNTMYQNMINGYAEKVNQANAQYDSAIQNARAKQVEVDLQRKLPLIQEEAAKDLNATQKASANSDPQYRYDYVLNKFGELDANLKSFVANLMGKYKSNGTFMSKDIDAFISELASKAQAAYKSYNTVSSGVSNPAAATPPAGIPPAGGTEDVATRTPSMVSRNTQGWMPKIPFNPLSNTPMQSTVGGV